MILRHFVLVCLIAALASGSIAPAAANAAQSLMIEDFQSLPVGKIPRTWRTWPFQRGKAEQVYAVQQEGSQKFLHAADGKDLSVQLMRNFDWNVQRYPQLSWRWRAVTLPKGAAENNDATNDSACGVYVTVGQLSGTAIKYVWSTTLPAGTVVTRREGKLKIKVLDSGSAQAGTWVTHHVNVLRDYQDLFGRAMDRNPSGFAVLTDGNATHTLAACDYDDFVISSAQ